MVDSRVGDKWKKEEMLQPSSLVTLADLDKVRTDLSQKYLNTPTDEIVTPILISW